MQSEASKCFILLHDRKSKEFNRGYENPGQL